MFAIISSICRNDLEHITNEAIKGLHRVNTLLKKDELRKVEGEKQKLQKGLLP